MIVAYVLIEMVAGHSTNLTRVLRGRPGVREVNRITGPFDVIAVIEGEDLNAVSEIVASGIHTLPGVMRTTTCVRLE